MLMSNSFSGIIAFSIFHLLDDAPKVLARLHDLLAAGGLLISQTLCLGERSWFFRSFVSLAQKLGIAPPILSLTVEELESLVSSSDFEIFETKIWDEKNALQWIVPRKIWNIPSRGRAQAEAHSFSSPMQGTPSKPGATSVVQAIR